MPQTVEALAYSLNRYNSTAMYRSKRDIDSTMENEKITAAFKRTLRRLQRSVKTLDRKAVRK